MNRKALSVGEVANRCGVKVSTLHFYEEKGLIKSSRNAGNQRRYSADVIRRVSVIKAAQGLGLHLQEIKEAFATLPNTRTPTAKDWRQLSTQWKTQLNLRIRRLEALRDSLSDCIGCGCLSLAKCPLYNKGDELGVNNVGPVLLDRKANDNR